MTAFQSLDNLLTEQSAKLDQLMMATAFLQSRDDSMNHLMKAHMEVSCIRKGLDTMRKDLEKLHQQNTYCLELSTMLESLSQKVIYMEKNIPPKLVLDFEETNQPIQTLLERQSSTSHRSMGSTASKFSQASEATDEAFGHSDNKENVEDCKKVLFNEPDIFPRLELLCQEEFDKVPKYMINRQPLEAVNSLLISINQILKAKYTLLASGKNGARKRGELDLYLNYKKQQSIHGEEEAHTYFFTAEDYCRYTKSKLDKTKLNLLTILRHCKRLREVRGAKTLHYLALTHTSSRSTQSIVTIDTTSQLLKMLKAESISTLSEREDDMDDFDGSIIWSQEDPLSSNEIFEPETKIGPGGDTPNSLCRLCAGQAISPIYIYSEIGESMKLAHKINTCLSIKVRKTDPLPKQLCISCAEKVNWCDDFDTQCIKAEETLLTMLREKPHYEIPEIITKEILCDEKSCPLCLDGHMTTGQPNVTDPGYDELYDSDIVLDSSDEEKAFNDVTVDKEVGNNSIMLQCLGNSQQYLKCGACMNLYHTKETLDGHKCKPNVQNTSKPYKCLMCNATFTFEERLNFHMQFHKGAKALYCEICKVTFGKELKLFYHYKRYHCEDMTVSCLQCGKLFENQEELRVHVCVDGKTRPHVCEVCNKGFSDGYTLKRHIVTHLPEKPYKCSQCSKSFTQKSRLNKHVAGHGIVIEDTQTAWKCVQCGEAFNTCDDADHHYKTHEDKITLIEELSTSKMYHCEFCNSYFTDLDSLKTHQNFHVVEKPYSCNLCNSVYKSFAEAVLHWKDHPRTFKVATAFSCDMCSKDMKELSLLYKHKQKRHHFVPRRSETGDAKFICELCGNIFERSEDIQEHGRDQCSKFPCDICGSLLPTANSLNAHKRRHSGLRPYVCNICGKSYTQSSHMWTHKRFHMGVKPYACEFCDQRFTIKPDLADHTRKKHTRERPFKCDVCNKAFLTGSVFYQHRLIHRGDRRYKCHYCEKAFTRTEALNNHIKIHTGEKPHACDVCGRCFRQKGDMRKHRRTQHTAKQELIQ